MRIAADRIAVALGKRTVLADVSFELAPGCLTAIAGPNGAGKSSCLRALAGLLTPVHGTVTIDGMPLDSTDRQRRARSIAFLPQSRVVHWPLTVERTVALARSPHDGAGADASRAAVDRALAEMDVERFRDRPVTELSGGELARVLMARVLAQETAIVLADEPTAGLDPGHQLALMEKLAALASRGHTVVIAMHDLSLAARYCGRILLMREGQVIADGTPDEVLTPGHLAAAFGIEARISRIDGVPVVLPVGLC